MDVCLPQVPVNLPAIIVMTRKEYCVLWIHQFDQNTAYEKLELSIVIHKFKVLLIFNIPSFKKMNCTA